MKRKKSSAGKDVSARARNVRTNATLQLATLFTTAFLVVSAIAYLSPQIFNPLDTIARNTVVPLQTYTWVQFFLVITAFGGGVGVIVTALAFSAIARLQAPQIIRLAAALTAVAVACRIVKVVTERARPEAVIWLEPLSSFSFPSAHAASAAALFGFIALYVYERTQRVVFAGAAFAFVLLIGLSRIVLGVHHFSDVIGGFLLGGAILAAAIAFPFEKVVKRYG